MAAASVTAAAAAAAAARSAHSRQQWQAAASSQPAAAASGDRSAESPALDTVVYVHGSVAASGQPVARTDAAGNNNSGAAATTTTAPGGPTNEAIRRAVFVLSVREVFRKMWVNSVIQVWFAPLMVICALIMDHGRQRLGEGCPFFVAELIIAAGAVNIGRYTAMLNFALQARRGRGRGLTIGQRRCLGISGVVALGFSMVVAGITVAARSFSSKNRRECDAVVEPVLWIAYMLIVAGCMIFISLIISGVIATRAMCQRIFGWHPTPPRRRPGDVAGPAQPSVPRTAVIHAPGTSTTHTSVAGANPSPRLAPEQQQASNRRARARLQARRANSAGSLHSSSDDKPAHTRSVHSEGATPHRLRSTSAHSASPAAAEAGLPLPARRNSEGAEPPLSSEGGLPLPARRSSEGAEPLLSSEGDLTAHRSCSLPAGEPSTGQGAGALATAGAATPQKQDGGGRASPASL